MQYEPKKILYVSHFPHYQMGGQKSMIALAENLDTKRYTAEFLINGEGPLSEYLSKRGFTCHIRKLHPFKPKHYLSIIKNIFWLKRLMEDRDIAVVHPDYERDALLSGIAARFTKAKMVWHVRLTRPTKQDSFIVKLADKIIAISEGAAERFSIYGKDIKDKISVVYNGVDTDTFKPSDKLVIREKLNLPIDKKIGIFVGQLTEHKGIFEILNAARYLDDNNLIVFCGSYKDEQTKNRFSSYLKTNDIKNAIVEGQVENIHEYMAASDYLILPSYEGNEGMGRVVFEAMACGCIPIGSDISGVRDAITNDTGILIQEKSPDSIVSAVECINVGSSEDIKMRKLARKRAEEVFSIKLHAEKVMDLYDDNLNP